MLTRVAAWVPIWRADTRSAALLLTAPWVQHAMETLPEAVRTGRQTFSTAHGTDLWSYLAAHPRDQADFDQRDGRRVHRARPCCSCHMHLRRT